MKKTFLLIAVVAAALTLAMCQPKADDTLTTITNKIQYDVPIINTDPNYDWWIKNIGGEDREALVNNIFDRVLSGDVQAYDYFNSPMSVNHVRSLLVDSIHQILMRPYEPYAEYDTLIIEEIKPSDISILRFLEVWKYDEKTLRMDKHVYAICPVIEVDVNGQKVTRPLFWVYTDEGILK